MVLNIIIRKGMILDGSGKDGFKADVGLLGDRIEIIGELSSYQAERIIDASGLMVAPGFINIHSHADITLFFHSHAYSSICQGITTEATGQCGYSLAPINERNRGYYNDIIAKWSYVEPKKIKMDWNSFGELLSKYDEQEIGVNIAPFVGHGTVRSAVLGIEGEGGEKGWVNQEELTEMKEEVARCMREGAFGLSTGLMYPPGRNALTEELLELCKVVASYGGIYMSHIRSEASLVVEAVKELINISRTAAIPANISHHKAMNRENWGKVKDTLRLIDKARAEGLEITHDAYPYTFTGASNLGQCFLPEDEHQEPERLVERLMDPETFDEMSEIAKEHNKKSGYPREFMSIAYSKNSPELVGMSLMEVAHMKETDWLTAARELYIKDGGQTVVAGIMSDDDLHAVMRHSMSMICTDSWAFERSFDYRKPIHPRDHGTYPRLLGRYVREENILTLEDAVRKITYLPAKTLRLEDRGWIKEGAAADITIFNPNTIIDRSTFAEPVQYPVGIEYVLLNGTLALEGGKPTGALSGKVLKKRVSE